MRKVIIYSTLLFISVSNYAQTDTTAISNTTNTADTSDSMNIQTNLNATSNGGLMQRDGPVYKLKPVVDIPVTLIAAGWSIFAFSKIYSKEGSTQQQVAALRREDINGFDRWAAGKHSPKAAKLSDAFFYGSMPYPIILLFDKHIRKDAAKIGLLYLEAMSITGLFYTGSTYLTDRYRPLTYTSEAGDERFGGGAKNSFIAGHPALVATSTFFTAKVFSDYHPHSKLKYLLYGVAIVGTGSTAYLRHRAGKHFPSDLVLGTAIGTLSGLLVPHFHKNKLVKQNGLTISPMIGNANGISMFYKF